MANDYNILDTELNGAYEPLNFDRLTGEEAFPRGMVSAVNFGTISQRLQLTYFTARTALAAANILVASGTTAAAATPSLVRLGLWTVAADDALVALVASTPNDTTIFAAPSTLYTKAFSAPYTLVPGQRYAAGVLIVTAAAAPTFLTTASGAPGTLTALAPRLCGYIGSHADLPGSAAAAGLVNTSGRIWFGMTA